MKLFPYPLERLPAPVGGVHLRLRDGDMYVHCVIGSLRKDTRLAPRRSPGAVKKALKDMLWNLEQHYKRERKKILETAGDLDDREAVNL